mmetsp:Transcript_25560/g.65823  ORF Transcript_25560/g.65823 Transcript_25560/m.65823 type:complete len:206 (-) Transcript_25560:335-952(-)
MQHASSHEGTHRREPDHEGNSSGLAPNEGMGLRGWQHPHQQQRQCPRCHRQQHQHVRGNRAHNRLMHPVPSSHKPSRRHSTHTNPGLSSHIPCVVQNVSRAYPTVPGVQEAILPPHCTLLCESPPCFCIHERGRCRSMKAAPNGCNSLIEAAPNVQQGLPHAGTSSQCNGQARQHIIQSAPSCSDPAHVAHLHLGIGKQKQRCAQ